jgi:FkbM family methyltransferase
MRESLYQNIFHRDCEDPKKTWTKNRHNVTYAIGMLLPLLTTKTYFDVGANIGVHAWLCNQFDVDVYCFEPNPALNKYIRWNSRPKQLFNVAVGDYNGTAHFTTKTQSPGNHVIKNKSADSTTVDIRKIDDMTLPPPGMIKFDVEGHETSAIKGASATITKFHPWIVVEDKFTRAEVHTALTELDYTKHSQWTKDSIWHHRNNPITVETMVLPPIDRDLRKLSPKDWQW